MDIIKLKLELQEIIKQQVMPIYGEQEIIISNSQREGQGDLSCPIALKLAKQFKQNPLQVAQEIASNLPAHWAISKVEVLAPGFINFFLSQKFLTDNLKQQKLLNLPATGKKYVIDYSSPNIAKPLGIHHILSTVIGQAAVNLLKATNNQVVAWNYLGDWGTQFGKLIYAYKQWGDQTVIEKDPINELLKLYVEFHNKAETNPELEDFGRAEFKKLEQGDSENRKLWEWVVKLSKQDLNKVYDKLGGIQFDVFSGEADREGDLPVVIAEGLKEGIFTPGDKGGLIVNLEAENMIPFLVEKSDGATLYSTRDIASVKVRTLDYEATNLLYVVDVAQSLHFEQLFASVKKFSWFKPETALTHLKFGRMSFKDGKMSTRKGNIIHLDDLIEEAVSRSRQIITEKNPELENLEQVAWMVGIGAIKYSVLSQSPETNIVFDWDKIISFEGNSAPYLQYSYARANSILKQAERSEAELNEEVAFEELEINLEEESLMKALLFFEEAVLDAANKLKPHLLANYVFDLCQKFNTFYVKNQVLNCEDKARKQFRLALVDKFCRTNKTGLQLLAGVEVPEKM